MRLPDSEQLNIAGLSRLFDHKSECYKLFWFQAILSFVCQGRQEITFEELINEMIADAWYMVTEYHLNLGPNDTLEKVVNHISLNSTMLPSVKKQELLEWLADCKDPIVNNYRRALTLNVPYRLQEPLMDNFKGDAWKCGTKELAEKINAQRWLIYYFVIEKGMQTRIVITPEWMAYLTDNQEILRGWVQYNMILYLQKRNPSVPGISDKLSPPLERKLDKVKKYWKMLSELGEFHEIYGNNLITPANISIDHFIPWSYVAHDEFWNLHPTLKAINSSKSNCLPDWDSYFIKLAELEYSSYLVMWEKEMVHDAFYKCAKEHLNNSDIQYRLYREGLTKGDFIGHLEEVIFPIYQSSKTCGFKVWEKEI